MRFLRRARNPTDAGNKPVKDPECLTKLEEYVNKVRPEAAYFMPIECQRAGAFVVDIESNDELPAISMVGCQHRCDS